MQTNINPIQIDIITIFPNVFNYFNEGMFRKAIEQNIITINIHNLRDFSEDKWAKVDDLPYGGGAGMVMTPQPLFKAINQIKTTNPGKVIYLSPKGKTLTNNLAKKISKQLLSTPGLILVCGRYEGIDQRVIDHCIDEQISIGKYILTGGELASMVLLDTIIRFIPNVLGDNESHQEETFSPKLKGKKEYPHYTRPPIFQGHKVPDVLLSGNHQKINQWRLNNLS